MEIRDLGKFKIIQESEMEKFRADTFLTKEPETIAWLEKHIQNGEVFWDVGANIGMYSLYLAKTKPECEIYSFEPQFINYLRLIQNIGLNQISNIAPFLVAISDKTGLFSFFNKNAEVGTSGGQIERPVDEDNREFKPASSLPTLTYSLMEFTRNFSQKIPNHIKIDVDGIEEKIIYGLGWLIEHLDLKSILIEVNQKSSGILKDYIKRFGFSEDNEFNKMSNHSRYRRIQEGIKAENIIFTRK